MSESKVIMPNKDLYIHKTLSSDEYKIFNQSDINDLRAILKYHKPYRDMVSGGKKWQN